MISLEQTDQAALQTKVEKPRRAERLAVQVLAVPMSLVLGFAVAVIAKQSEIDALQDVLHPIFYAVFAAALFWCWCRSAVYAAPVGGIVATARGMLEAGFLLAVYSLPFVLLFYFSTPSFPPRWVDTQVLIQATYPAQDSMRNRAFQRTTLTEIGRGLSIPIAGAVSQASISEDGVMTVQSDKLGVTIIFTPVAEPVSGNEMGPRLKWLCKGTPARRVPPNCR